MTTMLSWPSGERPVTRLRDAGPGALSNAEILACVLQTPGERGTEQARTLLERFGGVQGLANASEAELVQMRGVGPSRATRVRAAVELARRMWMQGPDDRYTVHNPADVAQVLMAELAHQEQEHFVAILLDTRNRVLDRHTVYIGSLNASHIRVGEIFRRAIRENAAALIVAHNHPSGDPTPSPEDIAVTHQLVEAGDLLDIEVLDHVVIGRGRFVSLRERGLGFGG